MEWIFLPMIFNLVKLGRTFTFIEYPPDVVSLIFLLKTLTPLTNTGHCRRKTLNGFCHQQRVVVVWPLKGWKLRFLPIIRYSNPLNAYLLSSPPTGLFFITCYNVLNMLFFDHTVRVPCLSKTCLIVKFNSSQSALITKLLP